MQRPSSVSPRELFLSLPEDERLSLATSLPDLAKAKLEYQWQNWIARQSQEEPPGSWLYWLILAGRGFGKTRTGAEWVRQQAKTYGRVGLIGKDAADMRSVMIEGESGILAICPHWERPEYKPSQRKLVWPNGSISELRTGEDPEGVRGIQFDRLWCDELAAWQYPQETWDMALMALRLGDDPRACITTTPKPIRVVRDLIRDTDCVVTHGTTFDNITNLAPTFQTIIGRYEGTKLGRQELYGELLEDEGLAYKFSERTHVLPEGFWPAEPFERFESMDYGSNNPTCWLAWAVDYDGNLIVYDEFYEPGLPSEVAPKIKLRRTRWNSTDVYGDPSLWQGKGVTNRFGVEATSVDEFHENGLPILRANNDRRAGYLRLSELLRRHEGRRFPAWHARAGETGSPTLFVSARCVNLIDQFQDAPLEEDEAGPNKGPFPGECVAVKWEGAHGHAHAAARYGAMSRPAPSREPEPWENVPAHLRKEWDLDPAVQRRALLERVHRERDAARKPGRRLENV